MGAEADRICHHCGRGGGPAEEWLALEALEKPTLVLCPDCQGPEVVIPVRFAQLFSAWGIELPGDAVRHRRPGEVVGGKWLIRFLWDARAGEEFLEYLALNRMTNDRWVRIYASGDIEDLPTPSEYEVYPSDVTDAQREQISREYSDAWRRYDEALVARGLQPPREERLRDLPRRQGKA